MSIKGIQLLPVNVSEKEAIQILQYLTGVKEKIAKANSEFKHSVIKKEFLNILSFQESVQSTRIEGTQVTFVDALEQKTDRSPSKEMLEVLNYMSALQFGVSEIEKSPISSRMIKDLHKILMRNARGTASNAGEFRKIQNHIGPDNDIRHASYVPIEAQKIGDYMTNLEYFMNNEKHASFREYEEGFTFDERSDELIKTAIIHAQFESIHPFLDGNGRIGRILIVLNLLKNSIFEEPIFFVSGELERERARYYNNLNGVRGENPDWFSWIMFFLKASERMADNILYILGNANKLIAESLDKIEADLGKNSRYAKEIYQFSIAEPFLTVNKIIEQTKFGRSTVNKYLSYLLENKFLEADNSQQRNKKYINYDILGILRTKFD